MAALVAALAAAMSAALAASVAAVAAMSAALAAISAAVQFLNLFERVFKLQKKILLIISIIYRTMPLLLKLLILNQEKPTLLNSRTKSLVNQPNSVELKWNAKPLTMVRLLSRMS